MRETLHLQVCITCFVFLYLGYFSHSSQDTFRTTCLTENTEQRDHLHLDFVLLTPGRVRSLTECAKACVSQERTLSFTFWQTPPIAGSLCVCYASRFKSLFNMTSAPGARHYLIQGRSGIQCGLPPSVINASASLPISGQMGDEVVYTCDVGFNQTGGGTGRKQCSLSGTWQTLDAETDPVCSLVECGAPPEVPRTVVSSSAPGVFGDQVTYECAPKTYKHSGDTGGRVCSSTGTWTLFDMDPVCQVVCPPPPPVPGFDVNPAGAIYVENFVITYTCRNPTYRINGSDGQHRCSANGTWMRESDDPICSA